MDGKSSSGEVKGDVEKRSENLPRITQPRSFRVSYLAHADICAHQPEVSHLKIQRAFTGF